MADWMWVAAGYGVVYGAMAGYAITLVHRQRLARRRAAAAPTARR
jgi:hypothetical protein